MRLRTGLIALLVLVPLSFYAGYRVNRTPALGKAGPDGRRILYYVDPMNPSFRSAEPGIAPCGMPLEPVYADGRASRRWGNSSGRCAGPGRTGSSSSA